MSDLALKMLAKPENTSPGAPPGGSADLDGGAGEGGTDGDGGMPVPTLAGTMERRPRPGDPAASSRGFTSSIRTRSTSRTKARPSSTARSRRRNLYDGEVWYTDKHIGKVIDYIQSQPWGEDTAIILTADHGEAFADHGMNWHGMEILGVAHPRPARRLPAGREAAPRLGEALAHRSRADDPRDPRRSSRGRRRAERPEPPQPTCISPKARSTRSATCSSTCPLARTTGSSARSSPAPRRA